jgi:Arf-GAP/coiled-coil/ANK repeat/PH domain-containing protein
VELTKEGYLFKRSHNKFKTWSRFVRHSRYNDDKLYFRRWFSLRNGQLLYMKRNDNPQQQTPPSVMVPDLRLCTIRPLNDSDRRFVFEILSPNR